MSAIAGIFNLDDQPVAPGEVELLTTAMLAHGPDGTGHHRAGAVALGHCLLDSRPRAAHGRQPLVGPGGLVVVFDGRLDDRATLASRLSVESAAVCDAELVLFAYRKWARDCPLQLQGEYVFAVWNPAEQQLFLGKDRVGARQVYYTVTGNRFAFASFDEALLALPGVPKKPSAEMVAGFLVPEFDGYEAEQTWLAAVRALKPAHSLRVSRAGVSTQRCYWRFEPQEPLRFSSDAECAEAFVQVFSDAVAKRVQGLSEPAALVSGGIDSASMLATLEAVVPGPELRLHAFSALLEPVATSAESRCILSLTANARVCPHVLRVPSFTGPVGFDDLMRMIWARAHPVDNALLMPAMLCLAAQRAGHRSLLHAASGDVVLTAPRNYPAELLQAGRWRTAWRECRAASEHHTYLMGERPWQLLARNTWSAFAPARLRKLVRMARSSASGAPPGLGWVHPDFARREQLSERVRAARKRRVEQSLGSSRAERIGSVFGFPGIASGLAGFQRVGSPHGIEMLDPWADLAVLEFVLHLPLAHLVRAGWNKWPARAWLLRSVSPEVRWRVDKEHFGWDFAKAALAASRPIIEDSLATPSEAAEFIDIERLRAELGSVGETPKAWPAEALYDIVTLIQWLRRISSEGTTRVQTSADG